MTKLDDIGISPYPWKVDSFFAGHTLRDANGVWLTSDEGSFVNVKDAHMSKAAPLLYGCLKHAIQEQCYDCEYCSKDGKYDCSIPGGCFVFEWRDALAAAEGKKSWRE